MRVIHLARKPVGKGQTTARTALEHGVSGLNIDASRVGLSRPGTKAGNFNSWRILEGRDDRCTTMNADERTNIGRWPANLILEHRPECKHVGTKDAKATSSHELHHSVRRGSVHAAAKGLLTAGRVSEVRGYGNEDGTETVEAWECTADCPVAFLDFLSGPCKSCRPHRIVCDRVYEGWGSITRFDKFVGYGDEGTGASRFFKQVQEEQSK